MARAVANLGAVLLLGALIAITNLDTLFLAPAIGLIIIITVLIMRGPEETGGLLLIGAVTTAPMMSLRPFGALVSFLTLSDLLTVGGTLLLMPTLIRNRSQLPPLFVIGWIVLITTGGLASLGAGDQAALSANLLARFAIAGLAMPLVFAYWAPTRRQINTAAWGYVIGQVISTAVALLQGPRENERYVGLTFHSLFFGPAGVLAIGMLLYLVPNMRPSRRWIGIAAMGVCFASTVMSGSRTALGAAALLIIIYVVLERSAVGAYWVVAIGLAVFLSFSTLVADTGHASAFDRLAGTASTQYSNNARVGLIEDGWHMLEHHPFLGNGFADVLHGHNIYLEVAYTAGVFGFLGFIMILAALIAPLVLRLPYGRLGFVALGWMADGMLIPGLWERDKWLPISLGFAAAVGFRQGRLGNDDDPGDSADVRAVEEPEDQDEPRWQAIRPVPHL